MNYDDLRRRGDVVRSVSLEAVLICRAAARDPRDKSKWHTERGPVSVTGAQFFDWHRGHGGGGAIDLVMHLAEVDFRAAVVWLEQHISDCHMAVTKEATRSSSSESSAAQRKHQPRTLRIPVSNDSMLGPVRRYLTERRCLRASLLEPLIESGKLHADDRGNAVFLLVAGKANRPVGAELRGTGVQVWRGMAPGTHKDSGYFWIGATNSHQIVICESAIDAISCFQIHPDHICISSSGARANPRWLRGLIACGYQVHCGFDADGPGDHAACEMISIHSAVKRLRPPLHDWNDVLTSNR